MPRDSDSGAARLRRDDRGVSTAVGYVLGLMIASLLISGLLIAGGNLLDQQRQTAVSSGLDVSSERLATGIADTDRLVESSSNASIEVTVRLPSRVATDGYTIRITGGATGPPYTNTIDVENTDGSVIETTEIRTHTPLLDTSISGGPVRISYEPGDPGISVETR